MALTTVDEFAQRIGNLDVAIGRMSALLDSMLPTSPHRTQTPVNETRYFSGYPGWPEEDSGDEFEHEDVMSDLSDDETVVYYNQYDFGDIDEDTDDITFVAPWEKPYTFDMLVTPPPIQQAADPPALYRPSYLPPLTRDQIYEDDDDSIL